MERADAKRHGLNTYETGRECKNGHLTYRYTQSGSCSACIATANGQTKAPTAAGKTQDREARLAAYAAEESAKAARREARAQLLQVKLMVHAGDLEVIKAAALAFGMMRFPVLLAGDVFPGLLPEGPLHKFNCHIDDVGPLRALSLVLHNARGAQALAHAKDKAFLESYRHVRVEPVPGWADRP